MAEKKVEIRQYTEEENKAIGKIARMQDAKLRNAALRKYAEEIDLPYARLYQKMLYMKDSPEERAKKEQKKTKAKKSKKHKPYQRQNHVPHKPGTPLMVSQTEIRFNIVAMEFRKTKNGTTEFVIKL